MTNQIILSTDHPSNEMGPEQLQGAIKVSANITTNDNGSKYLCLQADYGDGNSLIQMTALNEQAKKDDARFARVCLPVLL